MYTTTYFVLSFSCCNYICTYLIMTQQQHPKLPFLSRSILDLMNVIVAILHILQPSLSKYFSTGMFGAVFILMIFPALAAYFILYVINSVIPQLNGNGFYYVALPLLILYVVQVLILDRTHLYVPPVGIYNKPNSWLQQKAFDFWAAHLDYFPTTVEATPSSLILPTSKQYVFAVHPHGIHCWPLAVLTAKDGPFDRRFPGLVRERLSGLAATVMFKVPVVRELFLAMGYVDARRSVAAKVLETGRSLFVVTGGEEEVLRTSPGKNAIVLKNRKGFVRLALSYGCTLVPVVGLGVNNLYSTYDLGTLYVRQRLQKATGIALPIFHGVWGSPLPYRLPLRVVVGQGIDTPPVAEEQKGGFVDEKVVDEYHQKYIEAVKKLYAEHAGDEAPLEIF